MKIDFSSPVIRHCFSLRCLPFDTPSQRIELINVDIEPHNMLTETASATESSPTELSSLTQNSLQ